MKVRRQSYGQKILNFFAAAILGVIMFLASFAVLFWNEGRENLAKAAGLAEDITDSAFAGRRQRRQSGVRKGQP